MAVDANDLRLLPIAQAKFLLKLMNDKNGLAFADGKAEGGVVKELVKKGWVVPFGRVGKQTRWKLVRHFPPAELEYIHSLCEIQVDRQVAGTKDL